MADFPATQLYSFGSSTPAPTTTYALAAYDSTSRRYWTSTTINFAAAPTPVGAYQTSTLTVLSSWTV